MCDILKIIEYTHDDCNTIWQMIWWEMKYYCQKKLNF